jgi:hypothetical protein
MVGLDSIRRSKAHSALSRQGERSKDDNNDKRSDQDYTKDGYSTWVKDET